MQLSAHWIRPDDPILARSDDLSRQECSDMGRRPSAADTRRQVLTMQQTAPKQMFRRSLFLLLCILGMGSGISSAQTLQSHRDPKLQQVTPQALDQLSKDRIRQR